MAGLGRAAPAAAASATPATGPGALGVAVLALGLLLGFLLRFLPVFGAVLGGGGLLLERRLLDLRLDLVAQLEIPGVLLLGRKLVAAAELAQLRGGNIELVRDPGIGAALADPGTNLVEL